MNTLCILITETVTVSNLIALASLLSEIWLATDGHTRRQTDRWQGLVYVNFFKVKQKTWMQHPGLPQEGGGGGVNFCIHSTPLSLWDPKRVIQNTICCTCLKKSDVDIQMHHVAPVFNSPCMCHPHQTWI